MIYTVLVLTATVFILVQIDLTGSHLKRTTEVELHVAMINFKGKFSDHKAKGI